MANRQLDILLAFAVKGTEDAVRLQKAVEDIVASLKKVGQSRTLDQILASAQAANGIDKIDEAVKKLTADLQKMAEKVKLVDLFAAKGPTKVDFDISEASRKVDILVSKGKQFIDLFAKAGAATKVDIDVTKATKSVDLLVTKTKQFVDLLVQASTTKVDFNVTTANKNLDLLLVKGKQMIDLFVKAGQTKVDIDLSKVEQEANKANTAARRLGATMQDLKRQAGLLPPLVSPKQVEDVNKLTASLGPLGKAIGDTTRTALFFRRIMLALGLSFVAREMINTVVAFDKLKQSLEAVFGSADRAAEEFAFIRGEAERLGLDIVTLTNQYSKFSIAAGSLGLSQEAIRDVFTATAQKAALLSLSTGELEGALLALEQIASKGVVSMEELRRQLGNALPGAVTIAAKGLGITTAQLFAMVENGQLASDVFLKSFGPALRATFGSDTNTRIKTTASEIARFKNQLKEFTDTVIRAGVLEIFTKTMQELGKVMSNPEFVNSIKKVSAAFLELSKVIVKNLDVLIALGEAFLAFKAVSLVSKILATIGAGISALATARAAAASVAALNLALAGTGTVAAGGATGLALLGARLQNIPVTIASALLSLGGLGRAISAIGAAAASPIVLTVTVISGAALVATKALISAFEKADDQANKTKDTVRTMFSDNRVAADLEKLIKAFDDWRATAKLTFEEINTLSEEGTRIYRREVETAKRLFEAEQRRFTALVSARKAELELLEAKENKTDAEIARIVDLRIAIEEYTGAQQKANEEVKAYTKVLDDVQKSATARSISFDAHIIALQKLSDSFIKVEQSASSLNRVKFEALDIATQGMVTKFDDLIVKGKGVKKALDDAIPDNFADKGIAELIQVGNAMDLIVQRGTGIQSVIDGMAAKLKSLTGNELQVFQINAEQAFKSGKIQAEGFSLLLDSALKSSLDNLGVDVKATGEKISKAFQEITDNLAAIATNAKVTGAQLKAAIEGAITTAKTRDELVLLSERLKELGLEGGKFAKDLVDSFQRLNDKLLETKGVLDSSLGDSFKRLGVETSEHINAMAELAVRDFERITASGLASAETLRIAFARAFEQSELGRAFQRLGAVVSKTLFDVRAQAVEDFKAVTDTGLTSARSILTAYEKVRNAILEAGGSQVDLQDQARQAFEALKKGFENGVISLGQYKDAVRALGVETANAVKDPLGVLESATRIFGAKTRAELESIALAARDAYLDMLRSGLYTTDVLNAAAEDLESKWVAAFGAIKEAANEAFNAVSSFSGFRRDFPAFDTAGLKRESTDDLKTLMKDLEDQLAFQTRPGSNADPEFIKTLMLALQQLINELNRRGEKTGVGSRPVKVDPSTGNFAPVFNFNGVNVDEKFIRNTFIPLLDSYRKRTG